MAYFLERLKGPLAGSLLSTTTLIAELYISREDNKKYSVSINNQLF